MTKIKIKLMLALILWSIMLITMIMLMVLKLMLVCPSHHSLFSLLRNVDDCNRLSWNLSSAAFATPPSPTYLTVVPKLASKPLRKNESFTAPSTGCFAFDILCAT